MNEKRRNNSVEYKKGVMEDSSGQNLTAFCKNKKLNLLMVRKWREMYENLSQQVHYENSKKCNCGSGLQPSFLELEDIVCEWTKELEIDCS